MEILSITEWYFILNRMLNKNFLNLLDQAIKPSQSAPKKSGKRSSAGYSGKQTRQRNSANTLAKPKHKSRW